MPRRAAFWLACGLALTACGASTHPEVPDLPDAGDGGDAGTPDSGIVAPDGGDAGIDAGFDAGSDAGIDDAGPADAGLNGATNSPYGHGCSGQQDATGLVHRSGAIGGDQTLHDYYTYVPASYDASTPFPVVVSLHGAGDTALNFVNLWEGIADQNGIIVLVPEASAMLGPGYTWDISDTNVVVGAMYDIDRCYRTDAHRHILHGFSAGGILAYILGLAQSDRFSGLAIASSDLGTAEYFHGSRLLPSAWKIPASIYHGEQDPNFPFAACGEGSKDALVDAGHVVYWHPFMGGHTTNAVDALPMYDDLGGSTSP